MVRMYVAQSCFGLSDEETRGRDLRQPDEPTLRGHRPWARDCALRHDAAQVQRAIEDKHLTDTIFTTIKAHLAARGLFLRRDTVVDATIIAMAPPSTEDAAGERDPDIHQAKKGNVWHLGMKAHLGVDAESGLVHTIKRAGRHDGRRQQRPHRHFFGVCLRLCGARRDYGSPCLKTRTLNHSLTRFCTGLPGRMLSSCMHRSQAHLLPAL